MNLFMLAAGLGTRLQPYTQYFPKPAIPFLNVPMGFYQFQYLKNLESEISSFVVNTHHLPKQIENLYTNQPYLKKRPVFSHELGKILGNGGALKKAEALMVSNQPILLLNADEVYFSANKNIFTDMLASHKQSKSLATLAVMKHPEAGKKFGAIWCDSKGSVKHIGKDSADKSLTPWHYIGGCVLSWEVLSYIKEGTEQNILYDVLFPFLERIQIFEVDCQWYETGNPQDLLHASKEMLQQLPLNKDLIQFIDSYDKSKLTNHSLISDSLISQVQNTSGFNCIAKSAIIKKDFDYTDCIAFADQIITVR